MNANHLAPGRGQDGSVEPVFGDGPIRETLAVSVLHRFRRTSHMLDWQILKRIQIRGVVDHERMAGLGSILASHLDFVRMMVRDFARAFF